VLTRMEGGMLVVSALSNSLIELHYTSQVVGNWNRSEASVLPSVVEDSPPLSPNVMQFLYYSLLTVSPLLRV
jgi:hypothetical protein